MSPTANDTPLKIIYAKAANFEQREQILKPQRCLPKTPCPYFSIFCVDSNDAIHFGTNEIIFFFLKVQT